MLRTAAKEAITGKATDLLETAGVDDVDVGEVVDTANDGGSGDADEDVIQEACGVDLSLPPPEEVVGTPPDGGRGWFILAAVLVILPVVSVYPSLIESQPSVGIRGESESKVKFAYRDPECRDPSGGSFVSATDCSFHQVTDFPATEFSDDRPVDRIMDVYTKTYSLFGIISGILIVLFNYRVVAVLGSSINILSLLSSAFIHTFEAHVFLEGFCVGVGNNMLFVCGLVSVMEYFNRRRTLALVLIYISLVLASLVIALLQLLLFPRIYSMSPKVPPLYACASYLLCLLAGATLKPLNLYMKEGEETFRARVLGLKGLEILKSLSLYFLLGIFLCYNYGEQVPFTSYPYSSGDRILWHQLNIYILLFAKLLGSFLVLLFSCTCCCRVSKCCRCCLKTMTVAIAAILLAVTLTLIGGVQLAIKGLVDSDVLPVYYVIVGFFTGIVDPVLVVLVPLAVGDKHLAITMGLAKFVTGVGVILCQEVSAAAVRGTGNTESPFYIGSTFILLAAILSSALFVSNRHRQPITDQQPGEELVSKDEEEKDKHGDRDADENV